MLGPETVRDRYGVAAIPLLCCQKHAQQASGVTAVALKVLGEGVDPFQTASRIRRHHVVIVPGTGVLEAGLSHRPWGFPYAVLCSAHPGSSGQSRAGRRGGKCAEFTPYSFPGSRTGACRGPV